MSRVPYIVTEKQQRYTITLFLITEVHQVWYPVEKLFFF